MRAMSFKDDAPDVKRSHRKAAGAARPRLKAPRSKNAKNHGYHPNDCLIGGESRLQASHVGGELKIRQCEKQMG